jgi:endoglycosylceramidase
MLRGVNLVGLEDDVYQTADGSEPGPPPFWPVDPALYRGTCPQNSHLISEPAVCEVSAGLPEYAQSPAPDAHNDLAQMRGLGFNFIRLAVNWSLLEPTPGHYDTTYVERIAQVVDWASQQGIYVLIDMHEDDYSRFTPQSAPLSLPPLLAPSYQGGGNADGAPRWAVMGDGVPALAPLGVAPLNAFVATAFTHFWLNSVPTDPGGAPLPQGAAPGPGLQDHFMGALATLVARFKGNPAVAGYEIMNEPLPGLIAPPVFDQGFLFPFYRRVIDAVTGARDGLACPTGTLYSPLCGYPDLGLHDTQHLIFFEPMAVRNLTDFAVGVSAPFTSYPNLVYSPHAYTHVFTLDTRVPGGALTPFYPLNYDQAMFTADAEARLLGAALFIGEYGNSNGDDPTILASETAAEDRAMVGSSIWAWKGNCGPGQTQSQCWPGIWSTYYGDPASPPAQNGPLIPTRLAYLSRVYPRFTAGTLNSFGYDPATRTFTMAATAAHPVAPGESDDETVLYLPATVAGAVRVGGAAVLDRVETMPDGSRLAYVAPDGAGPYRVAVG